MKFQKFICLETNLVFISSQFIMSVVLIKLHRNGQSKTYPVQVSSWEQLEAIAHKRLEDLRTYVGSLEFRDASQEIINEFRVPLTGYSYEDIWVCLPKEQWIEPPPPYRCPSCGDTLRSHKCRGSLQDGHRSTASFLTLGPLKSILS